MIEKIGVIYQDANSLGLLKGLKARLKCDAEWAYAPTNVGKSVYMTRKQAMTARAKFRKEGVDLIVRFTDADDHRWQDVRRGEQKTFEDITGETLVCGVAVRNTELWLNLMQPYLAEKLNIPPADLSTSEDPTGLIKNALKKMQGPDQDASDLVASIVKEAPDSAFRAMLDHASFQRFYTDCRAEAKKADCTVPNELSPAEG